MWFIIILAVIIFLLMEHALAFWLVFVPLALIFIVAAVKLPRNTKSAVGSLVTMTGVFILMILGLLIVCS